jgi:hypothetical protein
MPTWLIFYPEDGGYIFFRSLVVFYWTTWCHIPEISALQNCKEKHSDSFLLATCLAHSLALWMEALCSCETKVNYKTTRRHIPEDSTLHIGSPLCLSFFPALWLYSPIDLGRFFSFLILYTAGRTPWTGDQHVERPLPTHRTTQT